MRKAVGKLNTLSNSLLTD